VALTPEEEAELARLEAYTGGGEEDPEGEESNDVSLTGLSDFSENIPFGRATTTLPSEIRATSWWDKYTGINTTDERGEPIRKGPGDYAIDFLGETAESALPTIASNLAVRGASLLGGPVGLAAGVLGGMVAGAGAPPSLRDFLWDGRVWIFAIYALLLAVCTVIMIRVEAFV